MKMSTTREHHTPVETIVPAFLHFAGFSAVGEVLWGIRLDLALLTDVEKMFQIGSR